MARSTHPSEVTTPRVLASVVSAVVVAPALLAIVWAWGRSWVPAGDWAMLHLAAGDMGTANTRWVGPYSRMGWSHPGPMLFWVLAVPWRITSGATWSLLVGAAVVNATALGAALTLAWRRGGVALVAAVGLGLSAVVAAWPSGRLIDPWNPWITVLATAAMVLAAFAVTDGDRVGIPVLAVTASFVAQSHVGYVPLAAAMVAVACVGVWRRRTPPMRWVTLWGLVPLGVLWLPVLVDQIFGRGNLWAIAAADSGGARVGPGDALGIVARQLAWGGPWMGGDQPAVASSGAVEGLGLAPLVLAVVVFGVALAAAKWRGCVGPFRLQMVVGIAAVVGFGSVAAITGPPFDYLVGWWWSLAALWWASAAWSLWQAAGTLVHYRSVRRAGAAVVGAGVLAFAGLNAATTIDAIGSGDVPHPEFAGVVTGGADAVIKRLGGPWGDDPETSMMPAPVIELWGLGDDGGWVTDALAVRLLEAGATMVVSDDGVSAGKFGVRRTVSDDRLQWDPQRPGRSRVVSPASGGPDMSPPPERHTGVWVWTPGPTSPAVVTGSATMVWSGLVSNDVADPQRPVEIYVSSP